MVLPLVSPLDPVGDHYLLSAHMLQHVLIGDAGPALILLSLRGPLLFFVLPPRPLMSALGSLVRLRRAAAWVQPPAGGARGLGARLRRLARPRRLRLRRRPPARARPRARELRRRRASSSGTCSSTPAGHGQLSRGRRLGVAAAVFAMGTVIADVLIFSFRPALSALRRAGRARLRALAAPRPAARRARR